MPSNWKHHCQAASFRWEEFSSCWLGCGWGGWCQGGHSGSCGEGQNHKIDGAWVSGASTEFACCEMQLIFYGKTKVCTKNVLYPLAHSLPLLCLCMVYLQYAATKLSPLAEITCSAMKTNILPASARQLLRDKFLLNLLRGHDDT